MPQPVLFQGAREGFRTWPQRFGHRTTTERVISESDGGSRMRVASVSASTTLQAEQSVELDQIMTAFRDEVDAQAERDRQDWLAELV
jgi:hypothetical protein